MYWVGTGVKINLGEFISERIITEGTRKGVDKRILPFPCLIHSMAIDQGIPIRSYEGRVLIGPTLSSANLKTLEFEAKTST